MATVITLLQILRELSEDFVKTGYLLKTPPGTMKVLENSCHFALHCFQFQKRYFVLDKNRLMYYNNSMVSFIILVLNIGRLLNVKNFSTTIELQNILKNSHWKVTTNGKRLVQSLNQGLCHDMAAMSMIMQNV